MLIEIHMLEYTQNLIEIPGAPFKWAPGVSVDSVGVTLKGHGPAGSTWGINREYVCICGICGCVPKTRPQRLL